MRGGYMLIGTMALLSALSLAACVPPPPPPPGLPSSGVYRVGKPYQIAGVWYYPSEDFKYDETGIGAVYPADAPRKPTANGEIYDPAEVTAAHPTLPLPSLVRVTNLENGRSLVARINERGPAANNRLILLSRRGAQLLGYETAGTARLRVQILAEESRQIAAAARAASPAPILVETDGVAPKAAPRSKIEVASLPGAGPLAPLPPGPVAGGQVGNAEVPPPSTVAGSVVGGRFLPAPAAVELPLRGGQIYVQVGSYGNAQNLARARAQLSALGQPAQSSATMLGRQSLQRLRIGPFDGVERADTILAQVLQAGLTDAKIVVD